MAKICYSCKHRAVGTGPGDEDPKQARSLDLCVTCLTESGWENTHSDEGHEDSNDGEPAMAHCWICHPELNPNTEPATGHHSPRRKQLNHRTQCSHPQTPKARRDCRNAHWAAQAKEA